MKRLVSLFLLAPLAASTPTASASNCVLLVLESLALSSTIRIELSKDLWAVESNEKLAAQFVVKHGHPLRIDPTPLLVDTPVSLVKASDSGGINNHGMILFDRDGEARRIKFLKEADGRTPLIEMIRSLEGYALGELEGSARCYRFGPASFEGRDFYYIEMEEMFPGQPTFSFKENYDLNRAGTLRTEVLNKIAEKYVAALEADILPYDPDFLITADGEIRWLDTQFWKRIPPEAFDSDFSLMNFFGKAWSFWMLYIREKSPENESFLKKTVLERIAQSEKLKPSKRRLLHAVLRW